MKKTLVISLILTGIISCNNNNPETESRDYTVDGDVVTISDDSPLLDRLVSEKLVRSSHTFDLITSGTIKAIPNNYAMVASPFAGRITRSFVRLGQYVGKGAPVFEISSPEFNEAAKEYYQARDEMMLNMKNLERQKDLLSKGVGVMKEYEEAEMNYALSRKEFESTIASLAVYHVDTAGLVTGQPLIVRSPISGRIVEDNIVVGNYLAEDAEPVAAVAELGRVWVAGHVKEKDIRFIVEGDEVDVSLIAFPGRLFRGRVYHISDMVDEDTRSVLVLVECENKEGLLKPGMYANTNFSYVFEGVFNIPATAVFQLAESSFVFVCTGKNQYSRRRIEVLAEKNGIIVVRSGLNEGDEIISGGGFYLLGLN